MKPDASSTVVNGRPMIQKVNLKRQLQFYLNKHDMSASQLAREAGVPKSSVGDWLAGSNPRDVRQIKRVADVFGVSLDNLMFGDGGDSEALKANALDMLVGDQWVGGLFEVRIRRVKGGGK